MLASGARTTGLLGLILHFLTDSFDLNFYTLKRCALVGFEGGNCGFAVKSGLNQGIVGTAFFTLLSSFFTRVEGGDRRPQSADWRVGVSC